MRTIVLVLALLSFSACSMPWAGSGRPASPPAPVGPASGGQDPVANAPAGLKTFKDLAAFKEYAAAVALSGGGYGDYRDFGAMKAMPMAVEGFAADNAAPVPAAGAAGSVPDHSRTNVQVEGVDEADVIKTDGKRIFALAKDTVHIVDVSDPDKPAVAARIKFGSRPEDIYVNGDRLVVFGHKDETSSGPLETMEKIRSDAVPAVMPEMDRFAPYPYYRPVTFLKVFDISDPKGPKETRSLDLDGNYSDSRLIGNDLYFIVANYGYGPVDDYPLPRILSGGKPAEIACGGERCPVPPIHYFDLPWQQPNFLTIAAIDIADDTRPVGADVYLVESGDTTYSSVDNLYLVSTKYRSEDELYGEVLKQVMMPKLSAEERGRIERIEAVDELILSPAEKTAKIRQALEYFLRLRQEEERDAIARAAEAAFKAAYPDLGSVLVRTVVRRFAIKDGTVAFAAEGEVPGTVLNQFSLDEAEGRLRIATTRQPAWSRFEDEYAEEKMTNNVYVLGSDLKVVGRLEGLAPGEQIYSARFLGERLYLVTYERTDPLFTIDLSVPSAPKVLGELKVPGFSNYLHPYGDGLLLGIGKDTSDLGDRVVTKGLKVSLFDVSDVRSPREVDTLLLGGQGSDSIALQDHKAVLFSRERELLVIPVSLRDGWDRLVQSGAAVIKAASTSLESIGRVDHSDGGKPSDADIWRGLEYYDNTVRRSLYIGDRLYTFSNNRLRTNRLPGLESAGDIDLSVAGADYEVIN